MLGAPSPPSPPSTSTVSVPLIRTPITVPRPARPVRGVGRCNPPTNNRPCHIHIPTRPRPSARALHVRSPSTLSLTRAWSRGQTLALMALILRRRRHPSSQALRPNRTKTTPCSLQNSNGQSPSSATRLSMTIPINARESGSISSGSRGGNLGKAGSRNGTLSSGLQIPPGKLPRKNTHHSSLERCWKARRRGPAEGQSCLTH